MELPDFLLARIAEDEAADGWHTVGCGVDLGYWATGVCVCGYPARVLAECDAKREMVALLVRLHGSVINVDLGPVTKLVRLMALPYADHPDYREEWRL